MSQNANMRAARLNLALALMNDPTRRKDAETELRLALAEPGEEPPDWRLHLYLGTLASDNAAALSEYLAAVAAAPAADVGEPTSTALTVLGGNDGPSLASGLDAQDVRKLVEVAQRGNCPSETVKLAVQVLSLRGEIDQTLPLLSATADSQIQGDPALRTAYTVNRALELVEHGDDQGALGLLAEQDLPSDEPSAATARALAFLGLGRFDEGLRMLADTAPTFDTAAVKALFWLRRAGESIEDERKAAITEADRAASEAARLDPSRGDGLLLRAQVTLEGTTNVESGRRLLGKAVHRLEGKPEQALFWRVQQRVRKDDLFRYMAFEVAAACGRGDELLALQPAELPLKTTTWLQDALLAELVAVACRDAKLLDDAVEFFEAAVEYYDNAGEPDRTLKAQEALASIRPTVARSLRLAEQWWTASFRADNKGRRGVSTAVERGVSVLDELDARAPDQESADRIQGAYIRGLLLCRKQAGVSPTWRDCWAPLPWLLIAAFHNPDHSYRATHLAVALDNVGLQRSALYFAERALSVDADDPWVQQWVIITRFNWFGTLDSDTSQLLDRIDESEWGEAIRAYDAILHDDLVGMRKLAGRITFDALWAHELRANVVTRLEDVRAAEPLWRSLLDESQREEPAEHVTAITAALALHDAEASRQHIDAGIKSGNLSARLGRFFLGVVGLVTGETGSLERAVEYVRTAESAMDLRTQAYMLYPILSATWEDSPQAMEQLAQLRKETLARLGEILAEPLPPLTIELDNGKVSSLDPALDQLTKRFLRAEELRSHDSHAAAQVLRGLADQLKDETISPTIRAAAM
jgi:tetratricopeptide (TPR) repeat protein